MAKICSLSIKNYRGIKSFSQYFFDTDFICLIGRGDSGKTTLLNAISIVLSPSWNLTFYDNDFFNGDTSNPIEIEASLLDLPERLLNEEKFGLYIRGFDKSKSEIVDDLNDKCEKVLTIKLVVEKDLEPNWFVVNDREEPRKISHTERSKLNVFMVSDYIDRHFSWGKGNPLYSLYKQDDLDIDEGKNAIVEALREFKQKVDDIPFDQFSEVIKKINTKSQELGIDTSSVSTSLDYRDISPKEGRICLHEEKIPVRLKGKGTKRLISIAIQMAIAEYSGIMLIDEIEQGLEPDRAQHLVNTLKKNNKGQVFLATHSRDILVELTTKELFLIKQGNSGLIDFDENLQPCLRANPESFFAKKLIVCEGSTEIGICRAMNKYRIKNNKKSFVELGLHFAIGKGDQAIAYCLSFRESKFSVCLFCDSDNDKFNLRKKELASKNIKIFDWKEGEALENAVFNYLPIEGVKNAIDLAVEKKASEKQIEKDEAENRLTQSVREIFTEFSLKNVKESPELRKALGDMAKDKSWYKSITYGEKLGDIVFEYFDQINDAKLKKPLEDLSNWIDND